MVVIARRFAMDQVAALRPLVYFGAQISHCSGLTSGHPGKLGLGLIWFGLVWFRFQPSAPVELVLLLMVWLSRELLLSYRPENNNKTHYTFNRQQSSIVGQTG